MLTFKNKPNKFHVDKRGKFFWESRSCAVEINLFAIYKSEIYILIEKRSTTMMDCPNLWAIPSGYLDYDESGWEAAMREVYEETGLDITKYKDSIVENNYEDVFHVITHPSHNRQNVILEYCVILDFDKSGQKFPIELEEYKNKEIDKIQWLNMRELDHNKYEWAFNHNERIQNAFNKFKKHFLFI